MMGKGNLFAAGQATEPSGLRQIRVIKTDSSGNPLASFDFGGSGGDTVAALATDSQGNLSCCLFHAVLGFSAG